MGNKNSTKVSVRVSVSVKTALLYGSLGIAAGALFCSIFLLLSDVFKSESVYAGRVNAKISNAQAICVGDSAQLRAEGGDYYRWQPATGLSDATVANPKASPSKSNIYNVTIYKTFGTILDESGRYPLTGEMVNGKDRILYSKKASIEPGHDFVLQFLARTVNYLDKATLEISLNGKSIGNYNIEYKLNKPFEFIWNNLKDDHIEIIVKLKSYDGDGDEIECNKIALKALASAIATTSVTVDKKCTKCSPPQGIKEEVIKSNAVKIFWDNSDKGKSVLRFKKVGEKKWMYARTRSCAYLIEELDPSFDYEVQMMCYCSKKQTDSSGWSNMLLLRASDRLIADVFRKSERSYKGVMLPIIIVPDSLNYVLQTSFGMDSPSDEVKLEVWSDNGKKFYSSYLPVENGKVNDRLHFSQPLTAGRYMVRIVDGEKTYMNQFEVQ